ncbi:rano class II histocompatibility antigen, A beta chain-like [Leuresthes tenuis]|uniref:rano class II histocompatibility antigen, A beta chain-like n=1 Tax=Leuresthes tenuis TaxID=355514 RepID=UPI003B50A482
MTLKHQPLLRKGCSDMIDKDERRCGERGGLVGDIFNKHDMLEFNSTRGNWTGFTAFGTEFAKNRNSDPRDAVVRSSEKKMLCEENIDIFNKAANLSTAPIVNIKLVKQHNGGHPVMLVCSAYNFYPKQIQMTWLRNKQEVTTGVHYSDAMADGELYYQIHSHLEFTPTLGETITCVVEHLSLSEPKMIVWDNSLPAEKIIQIVVGVCGLVLGIVIMSSGLIYYKKKSAAFFPVNQDQTPMDNASAALLM